MLAADGVGTLLCVQLLQLALHELALLVLCQLAVTCLNTGCVGSLHTLACDGAVESGGVNAIMAGIPMQLLQLVLHELVLSVLCQLTVTCLNTGCIGGLHMQLSPDRHPIAARSDCCGCHLHGGQLPSAWLEDAESFPLLISAWYTDSRSTVVDVLIYGMLTQGMRRSPLISLQATSSLMRE